MVNRCVAQYTLHACQFHAFYPWTPKFSIAMHHVVIGKEWLWILMATLKINHFITWASKLTVICCSRLWLWYSAAGLGSVWKRGKSAQVIEASQHCRVYWFLSGLSAMFLKYTCIDYREIFKLRPTYKISLSGIETTYCKLLLLHRSALPLFESRK